MIPLLLAAAMPALMWDKGPETVEILRSASIPCIAVAPDAAKAWQSTGFCVKEVSPDQLIKLPKPGVRWGMRGAGTASATQAPWVDANGWRFMREPGGKFLYELPPGVAPMAAAEAFVYGADAWMRIDQGDVKPLGNMFEFLKQVAETPDLKPVANIALIDNESKALPEVMNLLARRNLLFRLVKSPDPKADLNVTIGSPDFPEAEAMNPAAVADKVRMKLTDKKRALRVYGSEVVVGRLLEGRGRARVHLLNYTTQRVEAIRVRVRGTYKTVKLRAFGFDGEAEDVVNHDGGTEFSVPKLGPYAVAELQ